MDTYLVTLADRESGADQRVLVQDRNPDKSWQEWVDTATFEPPLTLNNPVVVNVHKLRTKRPHKTVFPVAVVTV